MNSASKNPPRQPGTRKGIQWCRTVDLTLRERPSMLAVVMSASQYAAEAQIQQRQPHSAAAQNALTELVLLLERKNTLPIILHADHRPAVLFGLVIKRLSESADLGVRQTLRRSIGVLTV